MRRTLPGRRHQADGFRDHTEQTVPGTTGNGGLAMTTDQGTTLPGSGPAGS
jgi:hypothetical protein